MRTLDIIVTVTSYDGKDVGLMTEGGHAFALPGEHVPGPRVPGTKVGLDLAGIASAPLDEGVRLPVGKAVLNEILRAT